MTAPVTAVTMAATVHAVPTTMAATVSTMPAAMPGRSGSDRSSGQSESRDGCERNLAKHLYPPCRA
jgi:hypothetical protein